jgi:hypothetical protein
LAAIAAIPSLLVHDCFARMRREHDPEKWIPVFGKDHARIKGLTHDPAKRGPFAE